MDQELIWQMQCLPQIMRILLDLHHSLLDILPLKCGMILVAITLITIICINLQLDCKHSRIVDATYSGRSDKVQCFSYVLQLSAFQKK